uniref:Uncharacterized protein n=1 Tax=Oryza sativa subsp. japonica TaxID=39947 RepID=Q6ESQ9_ORYSJ|nr:hypothetical protein [Oryza sativa Japonica Group]BAD28311.1 hypothetical protein [Oryza sativa Japonica Group]
MPTPPCHTRRPPSRSSGTAPPNHQRSNGDVDEPGDELLQIITAPRRRHLHAHRRVWRRGGGVQQQLVVAMHSDGIVEAGYELLHLHARQGHRRRRRAPQYIFCLSATLRPSLHRLSPYRFPSSPTGIAARLSHLAYHRWVAQWLSLCSGPTHRVLKLPPPHSSAVAYLCSFVVARAKLLEPHTPL